jgi:histidyl-tRNA synthetase
MKFKSPRGTRDFLPQEMNKINYITNTFRDVFEQYGFEPLNTPVFESLDTLRIKCGDEVEKQIYKFKDKKGRELGLRFDLTVPLARIIAGNPTLLKPFRRYGISKVWRYERPEAKRRFREFLQADFDIIGSDKEEADVEVLAVACDCLKAIGLHDFCIKLNNRKVLEALSRLAGIPRNKHLDVFRIIDKLEKVGLSNVRVELLEKLGLEAKEAVEKLLGFIRKNEKQMVQMSKEYQSIKIGNQTGVQRLIEGLEEMMNIQRIAGEYGVSETIRMDFSLARGLDYYTGSVFEIVIEKGREFGSVGGGGRYDELIELYGGERTPATGISLGIDRIVMVMKNKELFKLSKTKTKVFVAPVKENMKSEAIRIAQILRRNQIPTELEVMDRSLKRQLEYVNKREIPFVVIVGEKEMTEGYVVLKDMRKNEQQRIKIAHLPQQFNQ